MKLLNKLEKEMFKAQQGFDYEDGLDVFSKEEIREMEDAARAAAKVAVDLAKRAWDAGGTSALDSISVRKAQKFDDFLKSEGIETENKTKNV